MAAVPSATLMLELNLQKLSNCRPLAPSSSSSSTSSDGQKLTKKLPTKSLTKFF